MSEGQADRLAALDELTDSDLHLLGVDEKPIYLSNRLRKLERLADGKRPPETAAQQHFKDACNKLCPANTPYEIIFLKYRSALTEILTKKAERSRELDAQAAEQLSHVAKVRGEWESKDKLCAMHYDPADGYRK